MTLDELISTIDRLKPNAFSVEDKVRWVNDLEAMIELENALLRPRDVLRYIWESKYEGLLTFLDDQTIALPDGFEVVPYGTVQISGLTTLAANNGSHVVKRIFTEEEELYFDSGSFVSGEESGTIFFDGKKTELLLPEGWQKLYLSYVMAQIDFHNAEFDKYANTSAMFNGEYSSYKVWFTTHYPFRKER